MITRNNRAFIGVPTVLFFLSALFLSCESDLTSLSSSTVISASTAVPAIKSASGPVLPLTLNPGDFYFSANGQQSFFLSRNPTGIIPDDFSTHLDWARQGGTKIVRVHLTHGWGEPFINPDWSINEKWAENWEGFFDQAEAYGISVIPVFGVWADWNSGKPADYHYWQYNPLNKARGGTVVEPWELFQPNSDTQQRWLKWVQALVARWCERDNIAAWEIFSEINLATGAPGDRDKEGGVSPATAVDFTWRAADMIRATDTSDHPVTLSLGVVPFNNEWEGFYELATLDFIEIHHYHDQLDRELIRNVRRHLTRYEKPVMIGESGLWSPKLDQSANALIGYQHAIWAGLVSGAMNGRSFWGADGYAIYDNKPRDEIFAFMRQFAVTELPVAIFTENVDFSGFRPLRDTYSPDIWGAAIGNDTMVLGWYRDALCEPWDWDMLQAISGQTVSIYVPGNAKQWKIDFYDTKTGNIIYSARFGRNGNWITVTLPDFKDDIAFKLYVIS
jgi:hypothetical protein